MILLPTRDSKFSTVTSSAKVYCQVIATATATDNEKVSNFCPVLSLHTYRVVPKVVPHF